MRPASEAGARWETHWHTGEMLLTFLRRGAVSLVTLVAVSIVVFIAVRLIPGDPITQIEMQALAAGGHLSPADIARLRSEYGLDGPFPVQYLVWVEHLLRGDLGRSILSGQAVTMIVGERLRATLFLAAIASILALVIGVAWGVSAAYLRGVTGRVLRSSPLLLLSVPSFTVGIALAYLFAVWLRLLPPSGITAPINGGSVGDVARHAILPATTLALAPAALAARITQGAVDQQKHEDYVRTAQAAGIPARRIAVHYTLRNALLPVLTNSGLMVAGMLTSAAFVEEVFSWPGVGKMMVDAVLNRDYAVLEAGILFVAAVYILANWVVDTLYAVVDPRISRQHVPQ